MKLDERIKQYESQYDTKILNRLPLVVRIDGRSFHTYTRNCLRPFDVKLHGLMVATTCSLVQEFSPVIGYTQSDEITLVFYQQNYESQLPFSGRVNKINSVMASWATKTFCEYLVKYPDDYTLLKDFPSFDCRCFVTPSKEEACNCLLWREQDAVRNSISMAAQSKFSHKELQGKAGSEMQDMLMESFQINWNDYPDAQKRGTWVRRVQYEGPNNSIRTTVRSIENLPRFDKIPNKSEFIFDGAEPDVS